MDKLILRKNKIRLNSLIIAIAIASNYIAVSMDIAISIPLYTAFSFLIAIVALANNLRLLLSSMVFMAIFFLLPVLSIVVIKDNQSVLYLQYFIQALLYASSIRNEFSFKEVSKSLVYIYAFFSWGMLFFSNTNSSGGNLMGLSYSILPSILASIYCIVNKKQNGYSKSTFIVAIFVIVYYLSMCITYISRGVVLSIWIYCMLLYLMQSKFKKSKASYKVRIIFLFILILLLVSYFKDITFLLNNLLMRYGINIPFVKEIAFRFETNSMLDGRDVIFKRSLMLFQRSPIYGNGTAAYARFYSLNYDHNFLLQMLSEGGIVFFVLNIVPLIAIFVQVFKRKSSYSIDYIEMCVLLICISLVRLLFSYTLWREQGYWMIMVLFSVRKNWLGSNSQERIKS